jgi:hypothetical protein
MSNYNGWRRLGHTADSGVSLSNTFAVTALTGSDATLGGSDIPTVGNLQNIEFELTSISTAVSVTMYLARDSVGDYPITPSVGSGATQNINTGITSGKGSVIFTIEYDYKHFAGVSNSTAGTIYLVAKVNAGSATAQVRLNWRS